MTLSNPKALNKLYRYCYTLCGNEQDAYDLLQTALEKYLSHKPKKTLFVLAYMRTIIRHTFIDQCRRQNIIAFEPFDESTHLIDIDSANLEKILINENELDVIWRSLSTEERELLYLSAVEQLSVAEIAKQINKPRGTILSIMHRMRKRLKNNAATDRRELTS